MSAAPFAVLLALAWFGATNIVLSLAAAALGRVAAGAWVVDQPARAGRTLFALRLLPAAGSLLFTVGLFLPAQWRWEPAVTDESAGYSIVLFAMAGAAIVAATVARAVRDTRATAGLTRRWRAAAGAPAGRALGLPVYLVPDPSPVMSVVGIARPTLFVAGELRAGLTPQELEVSLAHEVAHARAGDNLKRFVAAWCPDALGASPLGRRIVAGWRAAMEFAADASAVGGSDARAVALASALVKVARLTPIEAPAPAVGVSRIHHQALLAARVERLLRHDNRARPSYRAWAAPVVAAGLAVAIALVATHHPWLAVHQATEGLVRLLP